MKIVEKVCCCKKCNPCPNCFDITVQYLNDLINSADKRILDYSKQKLCLIFNGYIDPNINCLSDEDFERLSHFKKSLEKHKKALIECYTPCLCPEEIQRIIEKVLKVVDLKDCDDSCLFEIDKSGLEDWITENPNCVGYETWEKAFYKRVPELKISATPKEPCKITYEVKSEVQEDCKIETYFLAKSLDLCKLVFSLKVYDTNCNMDLKPKVTEADCKLQFDIVSKKYPDCKLDYKAYSNLIDCGMNLDIISNILDCGLQLELQANQGDPCLVYEGRALSINDLNLGISAEEIHRDIVKELSIN